MSRNSAIEWTNATWNPVTGCTKVSVGCDNCYAERLSERFRGVKGHPFETGFDLTLRPARLEQPLSWRRSQLIFVNSMSDLFHKDIPEEYIHRVFDTMERARLARVPGTHKAQFADAPLCPRALPGRECAVTYLARRLHRERCCTCAAEASQRDQRIGPLCLIRATTRPDWGTSISKIYTG